MPVPAAASAGSTIGAADPVRAKRRAPGSKAMQGLDASLVVDSKRTRTASEPQLPARSRPKSRKSSRKTRRPPPRAAAQAAAAASSSGVARTERTLAAERTTHAVNLYRAGVDVQSLPSQGAQ